KDANGNWSHSIPNLIYKEKVVTNPIPNVSKAEFFFDTEPGFGNGIDITIAEGQDISFPLSGNISSLSKGLHTLYVRVKDANGKWSLTHNQLFYKENIISNPVPNITKAEYFIDVDTGFGSGTPFVISPETQDITQAIDLPATGLTKGFHRLYIRVLDANNKWSITNTSLFYYEQIVNTPALTDLINMEWFWETDPGFGNATKITFPAGNNGQITDFVMTIPAPSVYSLTYQNFYLRTIDANWSLTTVKKVDFSNIVLPVTLLEFTARAENKTVVTNWSTAQEINLKHFIVEHSADGINFNSIGTVNASGSSATNNSYEFVHNNPSFGANYYRLKQVDNDDTYTYSPVVRINFNAGKKLPIAYPNPVKSTLTLAIPYDLFNLENYQIVIRDAKNALVKKQNLTHATSQIKLDNLASGTYWLILTDQKGNRIWTQTIIKK
ncbi:MAG: T9SS type A sorting domain-containing protein, partial [Ferruginibacter sp.]